MLDDPRSQKAVECAELFADGLASQCELEAAQAAALAAARAIVKPEQPMDDHALWLKLRAANAATSTTREVACWTAPVTAARASGIEAMIQDPQKEPKDSAHLEVLLREQRSPQADLLRDIFGSLPFRAIPISRTLLTWNHGEVVRLAQSAYEERILPEGTLDRTRLAVLANALEEAGWTDDDILEHLRQTDGVHVRGCRCVDLLLGKT